MAEQTKENHWEVQQIIYVGATLSQFPIQVIYCGNQGLVNSPKQAKNHPKMDLDHLFYPEMQN